MLTLLLLVLALVCFLAVAINVNSPRVNLHELGIVLLILAYIVHTYPSLLH